MKKTIPILIAMLLGFSTAWAQSRNYDFYSDAPSGQTLYYRINTTGTSYPYATIVAPLTMSNTYNNPWRDFNEPSGDLVIPDSVLYVDDYGLRIWLPVTSIDDNAFYHCSGLTSINIPNSVTSIGNSAFDWCSGLTSINIPNSVTSIGNSAFHDCSNLTSINIPNSVTSIGNSAFRSCSSLTSINIPNSVTSIGQYAFNGCTRLTSINIPNSITHIANGAFSGCISLTTIDLPNSVTYIGNSAFTGCTYLTSVNIPDSATSIGDGPLWSSSIGYIGENAFYRCTRLTYIDIPNSVGSIGIQAFCGCTSLTSINIPNSVISIRMGAFSGCTSLTSINIPNSVTSIEQAAFAGCTSLTSINIPNSVTSIGSLFGEYEYYNGVFQGCTSLTSIEIPNSVTGIGRNAFWGCDNLAYIIIPGSVTYIKSNAFVNCKKLDTIYALSANAPSLGNDVFLNTPSLKRVFVPCNSNYGSVWGTTGFVYEIPNFSLIVISDNIHYGSTSYVQEGNCNQPYIIKANPNIGYRFTQWSDGNTDNPRTLTLWKNTILTAFFEAHNVTVTALSNDTLMGRVTGGGSYPANAEVTVQAIPNSGYRFVRWSDGVLTNPSTMTNPRTIIADNDTSFTAYFESTVTITVQSNDTLMGSVSGEGSYLRNSIVRLQAIPNSGYRFVRWSDGVTTNPRTLTANNDVSFTAIFEADSFTVTANSNNNIMGSVTGGGSYLRNADATLQAIPNSDYRFVRWSDGVTANPRTITVSDDTSLTAFFELDNVYVTVNRNDAMMGSVIGGGQYLRNTEVTLQATPNRGYHFVGWSDGENTNPRTLIVISDTTFTAIFEADIFTITANSTDTLMGSVTGSGNYPTNTTVTLQAVPNRGYHFVRWSDNITDNPRTLTVSGDTTLTAYFEAITITLTVNSNDDMMGSVIGGGWYEAHTELTLQAIPNSGYRFVRWNDNITTNPRTVIAFSDTSFTAYFAPDENAGIDGIETLNAMIYTSNGEIVVDGAERNTVWLYDANGRLLSTKQNDYSLLRFNVPTSGTYFVKIGKHPAQKVIVIK